MQGFQDYRLGYQSVVGETPLTELAVVGQIPSWLNGNLIRNGPAKYEVGEASLNHWFDGFAMVHKLSFNEGKAKYASKFLQSDAYKNALRTGKISANEFATNKEASLLENLMRPFTYKPTDNSNVNVLPWNGECLAMTETPYPIMFDRSSLNTLGHLNYQDNLAAQLITAHPHFDFVTREIINVATKLGPRSEYIVVKINSGNAERKPIAAISVKRPGYMHSFAMTRKYVVLVEFPLVINPLELLFSGKPYIENYHWQSQAATRLFIVNKSSGDVIGPLETDSCFAFHHVNSFERNGQIIVDLLAYPDASIVKSLYLSGLMAANNKVETPQLFRLSIDINKRSAKREMLFEHGLELPRINYQRCSGNSYRCAYAVGLSRDSIYLDRLTKLDLVSNEAIHWQEDLCFPGEPVFVPKPDGSAEDEGLLLSVVLDAKHKNSFVLILDAQNMQEYARAIIPNIMPFGFHGQFMED